jgi:hypothetical protein
MGGDQIALGQTTAEKTWVKILTHLPPDVITIRKNPYDMTPCLTDSLQKVRSCYARVPSCGSNDQVSVPSLFLAFIPDADGKYGG